MATKTSTKNSATSTKGTKAMTSTTSTKPATKATQAKKPAATATKAKKPAVKLTERTPDLGEFKQGDKVETKDGRVWQVEGPAQGGTTLKLTRKLDSGKTESVFRFARNISATK